MVGAREKPGRACPRATESISQVTIDSREHEKGREKLPSALAEARAACKWGRWEWAKMSSLESGQKETAMSPRGRTAGGTKVRSEGGVPKTKDRRPGDARHREHCSLSKRMGLES